ncbi:type II toxin-antitoxin system PemK/MazF family toxin [Micromonospora orduensis]|uniref:Type II toxin-antitoxin system PemK/MazF family toxin n=2 Tax=Micromonospora orduensis TaxID=1420891 RepID=A0A5C4QF82_9ACTN|nr:type II toxin-antitoxin system PemK/MazF family toxin [Micromonospora orduensis]
MPEALLWSVALLLAVAAGWAWNSWRHRVADRRPGRDGTRRPTAPRPRGADRPSARPRSRATERAAGTPAPGEIWWADVPYADGSGSKVRPCLVLRADSRGADVLKITSQDKSDRDDHVRIPTRDWDPGAEHDSYLSLTEPIRISSADFADRAGRCDADLWRQVRALRHLPTS